MNFHKECPATCATRFPFKRILILLKLLRGKGVAQVAGHISMEISTFELKIYDLLQQVAQVGPPIPQKNIFPTRQGWNRCTVWIQCRTRPVSFYPDKNELRQVHPKTEHCSTKKYSQFVRCPSMLHI